MLSYDQITWALENSKVLYEPDRRIDTFGSTNFEFFLISELMDEINKVRVRRGKMEAQRPQILRPDGYDDLMFEGFGEHADAFAAWFKDNASDLSFLKYGFTFAMRDLSENIVHDSMEAVCDKVVEDVRSSGNPIQAVIAGVDDTWDISLLKFNMDMIQKSQEINEFDFRRKGLL
ncbi:MAG: hypothetical protein P1V20_12180 [Verrucomicrobiales bacterium]|nr:hypothetical protein [Verrucomicrobiales bacterium]